MFTLDFLTTIGTGIAVIGFIYNLIRNMKFDLEKKIDAIDCDIKSDMRAQSARTDKLYEMFVQLQKDNNDLLHKILDRKLKTEP